MKKYKDLYEEEKQRHEEALHRYQEDHMNEMEIISLHKRCNKNERKVSQPRKASGSPGLIDDPSEEGQKPKKASMLSNGKKTATKAGKNVKKTLQPKKHQSHLNLLTQARKGRVAALGRWREKKCLLCWG